MNLMDAARTGLPLRRLKDKEFYGEDGWFTLEPREPMALDREDILAEDWETKPIDPNPNS